MRDQNHGLAALNNRLQAQSDGQSNGLQVAHDQAAAFAAKLQLTNVATLAKMKQHYNSRAVLRHWKAACVDLAATRRSSRHRMQLLEANERTAQVELQVGVARQKEAEFEGTIEKLVEELGLSVGSINDLRSRCAELERERKHQRRKAKKDKKPLDRSPTNRTRV